MVEGRRTMKTTALVFEAVREGYGIDQIRNPVTVGELKMLLEDCDEDALFILSHDGGYTYGSIARCGELRTDPGDDQSEWEVVDEVAIW